MDDSNKLLEKVELVVFDFDGVFTDNAVWVSSTGVETVRCSRSDGLGLSKLRSIGIVMHILSTETNPVVTVRAAKMQLPVTQGVDDKAHGFLSICEKYNVLPRNAAFIGNDINDIPALKLAGVPIAVADAHEDILPHVLLRTAKRGGHGAVRELCDKIFKSKSPNGNS